MRFVQYHLTLCPPSHFPNEDVQQYLSSACLRKFAEKFSSKYKHNFIPGILGMCSANTNPKHNVQMASEMKRKRDKNEIK